MAFKCELLQWWTKLKFWLLAIAGILTFAIFAAIAFSGFIDARMMHSVYDYLSLKDVTSEGFQRFDESPAPLHNEFYFWHVTNPDEVLNGSKPTLEERGPYTYREFYVNRNLSFTDRCHIKFGSYTSYKYAPDRSCADCSMDDKIMMINLPMVFLIENVVRADLEEVVKKGVLMSMGACEADTEFMEIGVNDFLFHGFETCFAKMTMEVWEDAYSEPVPGNYEKPDLFSMLKKTNDSTYGSWFEIETGSCGHDPDVISDNFFQYSKYGLLEETLSPTLQPTGWYAENGGWNGSDICNVVKGVCAGYQLAPGIDMVRKRRHEFYVFSTTICRSLNMEFTEEREIFGLKVLRYEPKLSELQANFTDQLGFCKSANPEVDWDNCAAATDDPAMLNLSACFSFKNYTHTCKDGLFDTHSCNGAIAVFSFPHFYGAAEDLLTHVNGMQPDRARHAIFTDIEPITGISLRAHQRIQLNVPLRPWTFDNETSQFFKNVNNSQDALLPVFWVDRSAEIDEDLANDVRYRLYTQRTIFRTISVIAMVFGIVLTLVSTTFLIRNRFCPGGPAEKTKITPGPKTPGT